MFESAIEKYRNLREWQREILKFICICVSVLAGASLLIAGLYLNGDEIIKITDTSLSKNRLLSTCDNSLSMSVRESSASSPEGKTKRLNISVKCSGYVVGDIDVSKGTSDFPIYSNFTVRKFTGYEFTMPFHSSFSEDMYLLIRPEYMKEYNKRDFLQELDGLMTWFDEEIHSENAKMKTEQENYDSWR